MPVLTPKGSPRPAGTVRRWLHDIRGVAAVEFALLLPVMLTLYIGSVEVTQLLTVDRKVVLLSRTVGDLTTQSSAVTNTDLDAIMNAASSVLAPLSTATSQIRITSIAISDSGSADPLVPKKATVCWSYHRNWDVNNFAHGTELATTLVPTALRSDSGTSIVLAEVQYPYRPAIGYVLVGTWTLNEKIFMRPRLSTYVSYSGANQTNNGTPTVANGPCT